MPYPTQPLGDLTSFVASGITPRGGNSTYVESGPILVRSQNVLMGSLSLENVASITPEIYRSMKRVQVFFDDVLLNITGASIGRACRVAKDLGEAVVNQHVAIIRTRKEILSPAFLAYVLRTDALQHTILSGQTGAAQGGFNHQKIRALEIPLPPLPEQYRIVEILDQADALRQQRRQADEISRKILPALFQEMFGDPNRNERGWEVLELAEAFTDVSRMGSKIPRSEYLSSGMLPVVDQGQDLVSGYWDNESDAYRGDLPVILFGDHTRLFKLLETPFCIGADGVRLLRPRQMDPHFAFGLLSLLDVPSRGYSRHFKELRALQYINPPIELQRRFGRALAVQRANTVQAATSATSLETLFQTLLHRAFDGTLTARWREIHAKELLQEIEHRTTN